MILEKNDYFCKKFIRRYMKKSLIFVGLLSLGIAYAQEGKVGVNTDNPKATLDIKAYKTDGSQEEGVLIPRLGKLAVSKIGSPEISTLVYINDVTYGVGTDAGADTRVAKVDTVGFYHYDGTQWVRIVDANDELWNRKISGTKGEVYLVPAENKGDFIGYKYQTEHAQKYGRFSFNLGNPMADDFKSGNGGTGIDLEGMPFSTNITSDVLPKTSGTGTTWYFNRNNSLIKDAHATTSNSLYYGGEYRLVAKDISKLDNFNVLRGLQSAVDLFSTGTGVANNIIGFEATTRAGSDDKTYSPKVNNNIAGQFIPRNYGASSNVFALKTNINNFGEATNITGIDLSSTTQNADSSKVIPSHTINKLKGINNLVRLSDNGRLSVIKDIQGRNINPEIVGIYNTVEISKGTTTESGNIRGAYNRVFINGNTTKTEVKSAITNYTSTINTNGTNSITEYVDYSAYPNATSATTEMGTYTGFRVNTGSNTNNMSVQNMYGMKIDNIEKGSKTNYAIHTGEKGDVRVGTLKGTGDRQVFADSDGVLKVSDKKGIKLGNDADTTVCNDSNSGLMFYKDLTDKNNTTAGTFAICVKNAEGRYSWVYLSAGASGSVGMSSSGASDKLGDGLVHNSNVVTGSGSGSVGD